jgi:hypothetical protein
MTTRVLTNIVAIGIVTGGLMTAGAFPLLAQETAPQQKGAGEPAQQPGMMGDRHKHHEQMEQMHREMSQELQKQLTALREHTKAMEGVSDEKQVLTEMKKHLQMTDTLLGTMLEQREKMHAMMQEHHETMHGTRERSPQ